jgi:hypothetical protein
VNKKKLERLRRESARREAKARSESEHRQGTIKVRLQELKDAPNGVKELAKDELGKTLCDLVALQILEIDYLMPFCQLVQKIGERFPSKWQKLDFANASAEFKEICAEFEKSSPGVLPTQSKLSPSEEKRRRQFAVGDIEWQFGGAGQGNWRKSPLSLLGVLPYQPICLDKILTGGRVHMWELQELFGINRNRFPKKPPRVKHLRETLYDYRAIVKVMDALLSEERKSRGRPLQTWPSNPKVRTRVLSGIEARIKSLSTPEQIKGEFLAVIRRHLPDSAKK